MRIIVLSSTGHIYANYILKSLINEDILKKHHIYIFTQDSIIPNLSKVKGLIKYIKKAGFNYVIMQIIKIQIFHIRSYIDFLTNNYKSIYYPFDKIKKNNIKHEVLNNIKDTKNSSKIRKIKPDLILSVFSKEIIPPEIYSLPKKGCINLHPAFLPFYKGISPTFWVLANSENSTGVTLHYIDKNIDTGKIIYQKRIQINNIKTEHEIYLRCTQEGLKLIIDFLKIIILDKKANIKTIKNPKNKGNYFSIPTKKAVNNFYLNGYKFFTLMEFFGSH